MALRYRILLEAKEELVDAAAYHEQQREGLGFKLFDEYDAGIEHALAFPDSGKSGVSHHKRMPGYWAERLNKLEP